MVNHLSSPLNQQVYSTNLSFPPFPRQPLPPSSHCRKLFDEMLVYSKDYFQRHQVSYDTDFSDTDMGKDNGEKLITLHTNMLTIFKQMQKQQCPLDRLKTELKRLPDFNPSAKAWLDLIELEKKQFIVCTPVSN